MEQTAGRLSMPAGTMRTAMVAVLIGVTAFISARSGVTSALFGESDSIGSNALSTATLAAPANPAASASCDSPGTLKGKIALSWSAATSAQSYDVYRSTTNGGPYSFLINRTTTSYTNTGLNTNTTYYYVVQSRNNNWASANSSQASATTPAVCT